MFLGHLQPGQTPRLQQHTPSLSGAGQGGKGFVELLEGGDCHDILLEVVGSQHLVGDDGKHGGDETVASLKQRSVRKSITMSLSMPLPLLDQTYFQSLLHQTAPYRHHTFILHLVPFHPAYDFYRAICLPACDIRFAACS